jgi:hypothetical protein
MGKPARRFVMCPDNEGYQASLERGRIYVSLPDANAGKLGLIRVIDESGEDYLHEKDAFRVE